MVDTLPILYSFRRCPYAMRARLAIAAAKQTVGLREVVLRDKPPELIAISPKATVPVLQLPSGEIIDESLEIMLWALAEYNEQHGLHDWLNIGDVDQANALIHTNDTAFKQALDRYKYADRFPEQAAEHYRKKAEIFIADLEQRLTKSESKPAYLFGSQVSIADMAILPFVRQFAHVDWPWFNSNTAYPNVHTWLAEFKDSPLFKVIMPKFTAWKNGDATTVFPL